MNYTGSLFGTPIYVTTVLGYETKQTRYPRSKRKRIRKKWAKKYTVTTPKRGMYMFNGQIICDPATYCDIIAARVMR